MTGRSRSAVVPPEAVQPVAPALTEAGAALTDTVLSVLTLQARFTEVAAQLATHGGITVAWWQVLGAVLDEPRSVAAVARRIGLARQGVQRIADLLVDRGVAEYRPNTEHQRAKLLACTEHGRAAINRIAHAQHPWANELGATIGASDLRATLDTLNRLISAMESAAAGEPDDAPTGRT